MSTTNINHFGLAISGFCHFILIDNYNDSFQSIRRVYTLYTRIKKTYARRLIDIEQAAVFKLFCHIELLLRTTGFKWLGLNIQIKRRNKNYFEILKCLGAMWRMQRMNTLFFRFISSGELNSHSKEFVDQSHDICDGFVDKVKVHKMSKLDRKLTNRIL